MAQQSKLNENAVEQLAIQLLMDQGFTHHKGSSISPAGKTPLRQSFEDVVLKQPLEDAIFRINPDATPQVREDALKKVLDVDERNVLDTNQAFHKMLTKGVRVPFRKDGIETEDLVWLVDFDNPQNNDFRVVDQFTIEGKQQTKRLDLVLFINGLPLVAIEMKSPAVESATFEMAYQQLKTYQETVPNIFIYNTLLIASDGFSASVGTLSSGISRFMAWKSVDGKTNAPKEALEIETLIAGMLNKGTLLDLVRNFIVFEDVTVTDSITRDTTTQPLKKVASYHQYFATNKAVASVCEAASEQGNRKGGVVWHTQGSGKSLTMVFTVGKLVQKLNNPTIVIVTDRIDLDSQLFETFVASEHIIRQEPKQAVDMKHLQELLRVVAGGVIFTTTQKFQPESGNVYTTLSERRNIVVIVDEAHRTQYGFQAKSIPVRDAEGKVVGKKTVYGFAKYMRDALPNATYLGFTGTPIENDDINTPAVFGDYVDIYDIAQAVDDKATVRIFYESRLVKVDISDKGRRLIQELESNLEEQEISQIQKNKMVQIEAVIGSQKRIERVAKDMVGHFEQRQRVLEGKGMIVAISRIVAARLYKEIVRLRPDWHSDDPEKGTIKVVMTSNSSDGPEVARHHTDKSQRRCLAGRMKNPEDQLKIVIVVDMWLVGFDVPSLHTLYMDKPMKGHGLMQAIARVNRIYKDKSGGLVVDYLGIASELREALSFYSESGGRGDPVIEQEQAVAEMTEKLEIVSQMFFGFEYEAYFQAGSSEKLKIILGAVDHILELENGKSRFSKEVAELRKALGISMPHKRAVAVSEQVSFFQDVRTSLSKLDWTSSESANRIEETMIKQIIDEALTAGQVVDIFGAAGIQKPDVSILSEDFLNDVKEMEHKNIALELLKKLLNNDIKSRKKKNIAQSTTLMEMLEGILNKYQNRILESSEVIDELIGFARYIRDVDAEDEDRGLSEEENAFYHALIRDKNAKKSLGVDQLQEVAKAISQAVKKNTPIDWMLKENTRAKLKIAIKDALGAQGFPLSADSAVVETIVEQVELTTGMPESITASI